MCCATICSRSDRTLAVTAASDVSAGGQRRLEVAGLLEQRPGHGRVGGPDGRLTGEPRRLPREPEPGQAGGRGRHLVGLGRAAEDRHPRAGRLGQRAESRVDGLGRLDLGGAALDGVAVVDRQRHLEARPSQRQQPQRRLAERSHHVAQLAGLRRHAVPQPEPRGRDGELAHDLEREQVGRVPQQHTLGAVPGLAQAGEVAGPPGEAGLDGRRGQHLARRQGHRRGLVEHLLGGRPPAAAHAPPTRARGGGASASVGPPTAWSRARVSRCSAVDSSLSASATVAPIACGLVGSTSVECADSSSSAASSTVANGVAGIGSHRRRQGVTGEAQRLDLETRRCVGGAVATRAVDDGGRRPVGGRPRAGQRPAGGDAAERGQQRPRPAAPGRWPGPVGPVRRRSAPGRTARCRRRPTVATGRGPAERRPSRPAPGRGRHRRRPPSPRPRGGAPWWDRP